MNVYMDESGRLYSAEAAKRPSDMCREVASAELLEVLATALHPLTLVEADVAVRELQLAKMQPQEITNEEAGNV